MSFDLSLKGEVGFFQVNMGQGTAVKGMICVCIVCVSVWMYVRVYVYVHGLVCMCVIMCVCVCDVCEGCC